MSAASVPVPVPVPGSLQVVVEDHQVRLVMPADTGVVRIVGGVVEVAIPSWAWRCCLDLAPPEQGPVSVAEIQRHVADYFSLSMSDLRHSRSRHSTRARQVAMLLTRRLTSMSFPEIGDRFARDQSTVQHACRRAEDDLSLRLHLDRLQQRLTRRTA